MFDDLAANEKAPRRIFAQKCFQTALLRDMSDRIGDDDRGLRDFLPDAELPPIGWLSMSCYVRRLLSLSRIDASGLSMCAA
ncbi:hypothetical protein [Paenibacillus koleovorans]|uniref:hypothetical protein n=1 Tax=Paenibacillus koleovorans TaxID=121608 RepID=UPI001FE47BB8|nr:hypothetical protein [Paenibacillus koleovorans]